jgi:TonB family protein
VAAREEISMAAIFLVLCFGLISLQSESPEPFPTGFAAGAYRVGPGISAPIPRQTPSPQYTEQARARKIVGEVEVLAIVRPDGTVGSVRRLTSLDAEFGLDNEAAAVAKRYVFEPGRKDGTPVAVVATIFVVFQLPDTPRPHGRVIGGTADPPEGLDPAFGRGAARPGPGVLRPLPTSKVYPPLPANAAISGQVGLVAVVRADGTVGDVTMSKGLDPQVDAAALAAVRQWRFEPAMKGGTPTPIVVSLFIDFSR